MEPRAIGGVPWTVVAFALSKAVSILTILALARLLVPADFGLVALALVVIDLAYVFGDLGLRSSLVVRQDLDRTRGEGTVLGMLLVSGAVLAALIAGSAPLVSSFMQAPRLLEVLVVLAVVPLLAAPISFHDTLLQRDLAFSRRAVAQVAKAVAIAVVSLILAFEGAGVWSLVVGQIAGFIVQLGILLLLASHHVRPAFDLGVARSVLGTSRGFLLQGVVAYMQQNIDRVAIGRILGTGPLGAYSVAFRQAELPHWAIADPVSKVTFPAFARMQDRGEAVAPSYLSVFKLIALVCCPLGVVLSATAEPFVRAILGDQWLLAIGPLGVLGILGAVRPLQVTVAWLLNSMGHAGLLGLISAIGLLLVIPGVVLAASLGGLNAVAYVMLGQVVAETIVLAVVIQRRCGVAVGDQARALLPVVIGVLPAWLAARVVVESTISSPVVSLLLGGLAGLGTFVVLIGLLDRSQLHFVARQARRLLRGPASRSA